MTECGLRDWGSTTGSVYSCCDTRKYVAKIFPPATKLTVTLNCTPKCIYCRICLLLVSSLRSPNTARIVIGLLLLLSFELVFLNSSSWRLWPVYFLSSLMNFVASFAPLTSVHSEKKWRASIYSSFVMVKQSHYRPGQALRVPGGWGSQISRQSAHEGGKIVSPTHRPPLLPRKYSWYSCLLQAESAPRAIMWPEGLCQWKIPITPSGIKPTTFRLVAPPRAPVYG